MKRFKEQIIENPTLDAIGHDMPMSPKRKKQLEADKGVFDDFNVQLWLDYTPYRNSSEETKRELRVLQSYEVYRKSSKEFMELVDTKIMKPFKTYFRENDLDMKLINELHNPDIGIVPIGDRFTMGGAVAALSCKRFFNFSRIFI